MQVLVATRLYGDMDTNTLNKGKRDEIIKKEILLGINRGYFHATSTCVILQQIVFALTP